MHGHKVIIIPWHATGTLEDEEADVYGHTDGFIKYCSANRILMGNQNSPHSNSRKLIQTMESCRI